MHETYNLEKAREEADKLQAMVQAGEAEDYSDAERLIFLKAEREFNDPWTDGHLERDFERITASLGLSVEELRGKKILDVGAGQRGFATYCELKDITHEVYSAEPNIDSVRFSSSRALEHWPEVKARIDKRTVSDKRDNLSFENETFDLVINHAALPLLTKALRGGHLEIMEAGVSKFFDETLRVLKAGGEARLSPLETLGRDEAEQALCVIREGAIRKKLDQLVRDGICSVTIDALWRVKHPLTGEEVVMHRIILRKN